jgi:hypothetical protein
MNGKCPKINNTCGFCVNTEVGDFCGIGIRVTINKTRMLLNKIKDMPGCPKLMKKGSRK